MTVPFRISTHANSETSTNPSMLLEEGIARDETSGEFTLTAWLRLGLSREARNKAIGTSVFPSSITAITELK